MRHISGVATPGQLLARIIENPGLTRAELLDLTGISRTTLLARIESLEQLDLLVEEISPGTGRPGRPAGRLRVKDHERTVLVVDLGYTQAQLAVATAAGEVLRSRVYDQMITDGPDVVLTTAFERLSEMLVEIGRSADTLCGVGISLPCPVDHTTGRVTRSFWLESWNDVDLTPYVSMRWPVPLVVDNDANVLLVGELEQRYRSTRSAMLVKAGHGVGASLVLDRRLHHGTMSFDGEIEHLAMPGSTTVCECGRVGCLTAVASGRALSKDLRDQGFDAPSIRAVAQLAIIGEPAARTAIRRAGRLIGQAVAGPIAMVNPERLLLAGRLTIADQLLIDGVREGLGERLHPSSMEGIEISTCSYDGAAAVCGVLQMVRSAVFSIEAVDGAVAR